MIGNIHVNLNNLKVEETKNGIKLIGYKESIRPLAQVARRVYSKKLKSRRLMKKYAKKILLRIIYAYVEENYVNKI